MSFLYLPSRLPSRFDRNDASSPGVGAGEAGSRAAIAPQPPTTSDGAHRKRSAPGRRLSRAEDPSDRNRTPSEPLGRLVTTPDVAQGVTGLADGGAKP